MRAWQRVDGQRHRREVTGGNQVGREWKDGPLRFAYLSLNGGLLMMCVLSLLPVGLMQTPILQTLRWMRVPGDTVFFLGAVALVVFVVGLKTGHSFRKTS